MNDAPTLRAYIDLVREAFDNAMRVPRQKDLFAKLTPTTQWQRQPSEKNVRYETTGYYHVTPYLDKVLASGVLKSKAQLERDFRTAKEHYLDQLTQSAEYDQLPPIERASYLDAKEQQFVNNYGSSSGLGAGSHLHSNRTVSLTYSYARAKEIYDQFKMVGQIVSGQMTASEIYTTITADYDFPDFDALSPIDRVLIEFGVPRKVLRDGDDVEPYLNHKVASPERKYELLQALEQAILADEAEIEDSGDYDEDDVNDDGTVAIASQTIGFAAPFAAIQGIRPENVGIIQCVIRKGAKVDHIGEEVEVRVDAADIAMIRYSRRTS